jgi:hypothetical protein
LLLKTSLKFGMLVHIVVSFLNLSMGLLDVDKSYVCGDNFCG